MDVDVEAKLAEYRARRRREEAMANAKQSLANVASKFPFMGHGRAASSTDEVGVPLVHHCEIPAVIDSSDAQEKRERRVHFSPDVRPESEDDETPVCVTDEGGRWLYRLTYVVYTALWCTVYLIAVKLGFGAVFLILSALVAIWLNTRTGPKVAGEVSAYSVFNPDCKAIEGTLTAEQFEREIRYGPASVR